MPSKILKTRWHSSRLDSLNLRLQTFRENVEINKSRAIGIQYNLHGRYGLQTLKLIMYVKITTIRNIYNAWVAKHSIIRFIHCSWSGRWIFISLCNLYSWESDIRFELPIPNYLRSNSMENRNFMCWYHSSWRIPTSKFWKSDIRFELPEPDNLGSN